MTVTPNSSISAQLAVLPSLPMADLWALWDQHFPRRPSHRNRNYVESRLAYRIQEKAYGALPTNIRKMLVEAGAKHSKIKSAAGRNAQPRRLTLMWFQRNRLMVDWQAQRQLIASFEEGV